jgi:hypothetical protein
VIRKGDILLKKGQKIIIPILSALVAGVICSIVVYTVMVQSQAEDINLYGTYQFDLRDLDNTEYLAVIPSISGDSNKEDSEFQWYTADNKMVAQGICKIEKGRFITFYVAGNSIATICFVDGKYYFVDASLEQQEITKISEEPMVAIP